MIRFIDIQTGNIYDGEQPYIHWFPKEQGINLIYSMPICIITEDNTITVNMPKNEVFHLLDIKTQENSPHPEYKEIKDLYTNELILQGTGYKNKFIYLFYITASSKTEGEWIEKITINGTEYKIGADFYNENESLYVNLSNNGIEIPDSIQKAIYPVDVHEDYKDVIVLNRKWKELLSNYMDIISNKGSYKSLINSLNWFEWGDTVQLYEIWRSQDDRYFRQNIQSVLSNNYLDYLNGFAKTTYLSLSSALEKEVYLNGEIVYDDEKNPLLEQISHLWAINDLSLKMSMLGNFYETYFMPIHLDLIHSTIEDVIYSNTFKVQYGGSINRIDYVHQTKTIYCNVEDESSFELDYVNCRVSPNTLFADKEDISTYDDVILVGVDNDVDVSINDSKFYLSRRYNDIGSIVQFELIPNLEDGDFIFNEKLSIEKNGVIIRTIEDYHIISHKIKFNILFKEKGDYIIHLQFNTAGGHIYTKNVKLSIIDKNYVLLDLYRIKPIEKIDIGYHGINDYIHTMYSRDVAVYKQYIPASTLNSKKIGLSNILILRGDYRKHIYLKKNYFIFVRNSYELKLDKLSLQNDDVLTTPYTICISKVFNFKPILNDFDKSIIYKNEMVFIPDFHTLEKFGGSKLEDYTIYDDDALCIMPIIKHGKKIQEMMWEFVNVSDLKKTSIKIADTAQPFIANYTKKLLDPGYYNVIFRYRLAGEDQINEIHLDSAFIKR